jgi:hypothetical protein
MASVQKGFPDAEFLYSLLKQDIPRMLQDIDLQQFASSISLMLNEEYAEPSYAPFDILLCAQLFELLSNVSRIDVFNNTSVREKRAWMQKAGMTAIRAEPLLTEEDSHKIEGCNPYIGSNGLNIQDILPQNLFKQMWVQYRPKILAARAVATTETSSSAKGKKRMTEKLPLDTMQEESSRTRVVHDTRDSNPGKRVASAIQDTSSTKLPAESHDTSYDTGTSIPRTNSGSYLPLFRTH